MELYQILDQRSSFELNLSAETIILGYLNTDTNFEPINFILLVTKHYLFNCASQSKMPRFHILKNRIQQSFAEQQMIARINSMEHAFDKNWLRWGPCSRTYNCDVLAVVPGDKSWCGQC